MATPRNPNVIFQEVKVKGSQLLDRIREVVDEGNARRIIIRNHERTLIEFPLSVGVGGTAAALLIAPQLAAIGAIAALLTDVEIIVERDADEITPPASIIAPDAAMAPPPVENDKTVGKPDGPGTGF